MIILTATIGLWTGDLWCWKWPLCHLFQNHFPTSVLMLVLGHFFTNICNSFFGYFKKCHFLSKTYCDLILGNVWNKLGYFLFRHLVTRSSRSSIRVVVVQRQRLFLNVSNHFLLQRWGECCKKEEFYYWLISQPSSKGKKRKPKIEIVLWQVDPSLSLSLSLS